ncbi:MAG TPA: serine hydrolase [Microscillaceae bacterium]|nr:serine hydrolase [Microscillaceae bacterium]
MNKILFLALALVVASCHKKTKQTKAHTPVSIESIIEKNANLLLQDKRFHSLSIGIYKNGKKVIRHFGELKIGEGIPPNDSTIYELASVTKTFLGTLAAKAVLEQKIKLQDDIRKYLPQPYPNLAFEQSPITIQHLLTHTSGFPNFPPDGDSKAGFWEGLKQLNIKDKPGSRYRYSNTAPEVMAYILEKVYQKPYETLLQEYILNPLQMKQTSFVLDQQAKKRLVKGYNGDNQLMPNFERKLWGGMGGLHATVGDMLKYAKYHLNESNQVVKTSHQAFFETPYDFEIGYYWNILKNAETTVYRHHGGIFGMQNWFMLYPKHQLGISIFTNVSFERTGEVLEKVAGKIYDQIIEMQ